MVVMSRRRHVDLDRAAARVTADAVAADEFGDRPRQIGGYTELAHDGLATIQRSTHLQANGVRVFAGVSAIAVAVFGGQILVRQLRREIGSRDTLAALGWRDSDIRMVALMRMSLIGLIMIMTAVVATYISSAIGAIGVARRRGLRPDVPRRLAGDSRRRTRDRDRGGRRRASRRARD